MNCVEFTNEKRYIRDFIRLSQTLYSSKENTENPTTIRQLLTDKHPLSGYFKLHKFLIYEDKHPLARFAITTYPKDDNAYLGFFECINDPNVAKKVFAQVDEFAKQNHYQTIVGPVDASFWIKYRLKINKFDRTPYTGEPYNKNYYFKLFKDNGYQVSDHYTSNYYQLPQYEYINHWYESIYHKYIDRGYEILDLQMDEYAESLAEVYGLLMDLYSDFPIFKSIAKEDFLANFMNYKSVINPSMVKLGYYNGEMVGFLISFPNLSNLAYHLNPVNLARILYIRNHAKEYVSLYMGVNHEHRGFGRALVYALIQELNQNHASNISALMHDGKVTQKYAKERIDETYEYVLMAKKVADTHTTLSSDAK